MFITITVKKGIGIAEGMGEVIPVQANLASSDGAEQLWGQIEHPIDVIVYWEEYFWTSNRCNKR